MTKTKKITLITLACLVVLATGFTMYNSKKNIWFEGSTDINCSMDDVVTSLNNLGTHYTGVIRHMPSMLSVELVEQGDGFVTIQTNEGLMKRSNISKTISTDEIVVEFDEEYKAGNAVTTNTHFKQVFSGNGESTKYSITLSELKAPGFMGFLYRTFGSKNMGKAFLEASKKHLESTE